LRLYISPMVIARFPIIDEARDREDITTNGAVGRIDVETESYCEGISSLMKTKLDLRMM